MNGVKNLVGWAVFGLYVCCGLVKAVAVELLKSALRLRVKKGNTVVEVGSGGKVGKLDAPGEGSNRIV